MSEGTKLVISTVLGIAAGGLIGYFITKHFRDARDASWAIRSKTLIAGKPANLPGLELRYRGEDNPLETLTISNIAFWNRGRREIERTDVKESIRVMTIDKVKILEVNSVACTRGLNIQLVRERDNGYSIEFDVLNHNEGTVVQVVHTGLTEEAIEISGRISGSSINRRIVAKPDASDLRTAKRLFKKNSHGKAKWLLMLQMSFWAAIMYAFGAYVIYISTGAALDVSGIAIGSIFIAITIWFHLQRIYPQFRTSLPGELEETFEQLPGELAPSAKSRRK